MSWDGVYVENRHYPIFEIGDEVVAIKKFKAIAPKRGYIILGCFNPYDHLPNSNARLIVLLNDQGFECKYASYHFKKSERQLAIDKRDKNIKILLNESIQQEK